MDQVKVHCHCKQKHKVYVITIHCLFITAGRQRWGWQLIGAGHQRQSAPQTASGCETGGSKGRFWWSESSQEVSSRSRRSVGPSRVPLRPLRLRNWRQGSVSGAHKPASTWGGRRLQPAVPAVRRLLRILFLTVASLLHCPQSEECTLGWPAVERRHACSQLQKPRWQEPSRGLDSSVSLRPGSGRGGRWPDL